VTRAADPQAAVGSAGPPTAVRWLRLATDPLERLLDRIYGSQWNPFYQSGNLAVLAFLVCLASGLVLFLAYHIADPHGSVRAIQESLPGGAWLRSLHRYSADLAVVAIAAHLLRKLLQGHTWGPRALAWISGVALLLLTLFCGWTGLVMVWDVQGQGIAIAGASLLDLLPIFSEPISRSFSGEVPPASSFFFMALFLHVALPLGLGALLWLHVSRVSRPALLPPRPMIRFLLATLAAAALLAPLDLAPAADLLALPGVVPTDLFFAFWLPLTHTLVPGEQAALWLGLTLLLTAAPWWWRPRRAISVSSVDESHCTGCTHCYQDCPYEAIAMVPRADLSQSSALVARVDPDRCVGCGICAGSCAPMGVGPADRDGRSQLAAARDFLAGFGPAGPSGREVVLLACRNGGAAQAATLGSPGVVLLPTGCSGSVHSSVVELLVRRGVGGVFVLTCPPRNCYFREGPKWLEARLAHGRDAALHPRVDRRRVAWASLSPTESPALRAALATFQASVARLVPVAEEQPEIAPICATEDVAKLVEAPRV
jgi:ferredoxin/coenzyme F420-reducing hydrogenase delta subunit